MSSESKCRGQECPGVFVPQPTMNPQDPIESPVVAQSTASVFQGTSPDNISPGGAQGVPNFGETNIPNTGTQAGPTITRSNPGSSPTAVFTEVAGPSSAPATSPSGGSNLSNGAVAGIAIATLIFGAAIAFIASFFLFKRRTKSTPQNAHPASYNAYSDSTPELIMMQKSIGRNNSPYVQVSQSSAPVHTLPMAPTSTPAADPVLSLLPPLATDTDIRSKFEALFAKMHGHVDTYYRDVQANITPSMQSELELFGAEGVDMAVLMQEASDAKTAIKHALVAFVLGITAPQKQEGCGGRETIFPKQLSGWNDMRSQNAPTHLTQALTLHRRLSAFLYTSTSTSQSHPQQSNTSSPNPTTLSLSRTFSLPFFPWAHPLSNDDLRENDLAQIINETLHARIWLFGQNGAFDFRWDVAGRGVVVWPWIVKVIGDEDESDDEVVAEGRVIGI